jgi:hypothetical protein
MSGSEVFAKLDFAQRFWQLPSTMHAASIVLSEVLRHSLHIREYLIIRAKNATWFQVDTVGGGNS